MLEASDIRAGGARACSRPRVATRAADFHLNTNTDSDNRSAHLRIMRQIVLSEFAVGGGEEKTVALNENMSVTHEAEARQH